MADQEQIDIDTLLDMPAPERSRTGRASALARLLHQDCTHLLELYRERESLLSDHTPAGDRIVPLSLSSPDLSSDEQVRLLHSALRKCSGLLECLILREEEEMGELEGEYETARKSVRDRLGHLLHSTKVLLETDEDVTPDHQCDEEVDGVVGTFGAKMWTYRVLLELTHWADSASQTLHVLHSEREGKEEEI
ncbi:ciliary neurotrophic factor isoform X1 [Coregonus clupeaformis]|uniref:ciliary neurotrophic factor isoform X1 n=1 Tax=Coregonus clupeaformis TaxID=59861 RepID=UPI001BE0869A|nr:ciliary neurotrophic factor isoform X1 [Coregonus clupeaformis]